MNILTFDVEEWFHLLDYDSTRTENEWVKYESRIDENLERIFDILERTNTKATFFVIGWIAKQYPYLVKKIALNYEIGSHSLNHQLVWQQDRKMFHNDTSTSIKFLEDITGKKVKYFRAPGFSIRQSETWAFETLKECGIEIDCSIFPAHHAHGGISTFKQAVPLIICTNGIEIKEFPISCKRIFGHSIIFSGGGYFRAFPYWLIKKWTNQLDKYLMSYIHPRDLDVGQPILKGLPLRRKIRSYYGLRGTEEKLTQWLADFDFVDLDTANQSIDWSKVPIINI